MPDKHANHEAITISIVTPTIDTAQYVDEAIASVPRSEHARLEHIIVHDGDRQFTERLAGKFPWLTIMSGPGRGATAAAAAAIAAASGDFVFMLNSDDRMLPGSLARLARAAAERPAIDIWTGGTRIFERDAAGNEKTIRVIDDPQTTALTLENVLDDLPLMTARFVRRGVYRRIGPLDERFSTCSDRELAIRMALVGVAEAPLGMRVSELRMHEGSTTIRRTGHSVPAYFAEHLEIARRQLANRDISPALRTAFGDWFAREILRKMFFEVHAGKFGQAIRTLGMAFGQDWLWPWRARTVLSALRLRRRGDS